MGLGVYYVSSHFAKSRTKWEDTTMVPHFAQFHFIKKAIWDWVKWAEPLTLKNNFRWMFRHL